MLSSKIYNVAIRRNFCPAIKHCKPLAVLWRSQRTQAAPRERSEASLDSAKAEFDGGEVLPFEDIPGPEKSLMSVVDFYRKSEGFTKGYKQIEILFEKYGPIFKSDPPGGQTLVHILDPDDFQTVFRAEGKYPSRLLIDPWLEHRTRRNYRQSLLSFADVRNGEEWHKARRSISPKLMRPKAVEENIDNLSAVVEDAISRFCKLKETCGPDDHIPDLEGELTRFTLEAVGTVAFDTRLGLYGDPPAKEGLKFIKAVQDFLSLSHKLILKIPSNVLWRYIDTPLFKKFLKAADDVWEIGEGFVNNHMRRLKEMPEKGVKSSDKVVFVPLLTYLLTREELNPEEVNGLAIDVVMAGVDTTATSLLWMLYHLGRLPHIQEQLYQEIEKVAGNQGKITANNVGKLPYLKACVKECLRLTPVALANVRVLDQDVVLSGYHVPAKTPILLEHYIASRSQKYFKDPLEFKPERWLRENRDEHHAFASLPFGYGVRMCVGRRIAEMEMYLFLCKLLEMFRVEYKGEPLELYQRLVVVPEKPVKVKFVDRV